jgi:hypothetical protein
MPSIPKVLSLPPQEIFRLHPVTKPTFERFLCISFHIVLGFSLKPFSIFHSAAALFSFNF